MGALTPPTLQPTSRQRMVESSQVGSGQLLCALLDRDAGAPFLIELVQILGDAAACLAVIGPQR
jgi:hypothetical protein